MRPFFLGFFTFFGNKMLFRLYDLFTILYLSLFGNILAQENFNINMPIDFILLFKYISSLLSIVFFYLIHHQYIKSYADAVSLISPQSKMPSQLYKDTIDSDIKTYFIFYICFMFFTLAFVVLILKF